MAAKYFGKVSQDMYHVDVQATKELSQLKMFLTLYIRTSGEHFFFSEGSQNTSLISDKTKNSLDFQCM